MLKLANEVKEEPAGQKEDQESSGTEIDEAEPKLGQIMKESDARIKTNREERIKAKPITKRLKRDVERLKKKEAAERRKAEKLEAKRVKREPKRLEKLRLKKEEAVKIKMGEEEEIEKKAIETVRQGKEKIKQQSRWPKHNEICKEAK